MFGGDSREELSIQHWDEDVEMDNVLKRKRDFEDVSRPENSNDSKLPKTNVYAIENQFVELMISSLFDVLQKIYNLEVLKRLKTLKTVKMAS